MVNYNNREIMSDDFTDDSYFLQKHPDGVILN